MLRSKIGTSILGFRYEEPKEMGMDSPSFDPLAIEVDGN